MRRFVTYIYQYEQGKRGKNAGFIKVDAREGGCRMELMVRTQERVQGRGKVYLIVSGEDALPAGDMVFGQGGGRMKLFFNQNLLGDSGYTVEQIQAVAIRCDGGRLFVSCWAEQVPEAVLRGQFRVLGEQGEKEPREQAEKEPVEEPREQAEKEPVEELREQPKKEPVEEPQEQAEKKPMEEPREQAEKEPEKPEKEAEKESEKEEQKTEEVRQGDMKSEEPSESKRWRESRQTEEAFAQREEISDMDGGLRGETERKLNENLNIGTNDNADGGMRAEALENEAGKSRPEYKKIEITDIRSLPKSNWHLCSNSFLIHGFFNYHYLMLKTVESDGQKNCWIGVPGVYEQPERMMALMFGFPEFEPARPEQQDSAAGSGRSGVGVFGYWMCRLTC